MCTQTSYTNELKIYNISAIFTKKQFRICTHFWQCVRPVYVTSQEDMNDSHFLPLDIASTCNSTSVLFLWGNKLNEIIIDAGLDLVLESYPQHTPLLKWQSLVCVSRRVINDCFLWPAFVALSNGMHEIRDEIFVDLLVLLVY